MEKHVYFFGGGKAEGHGGMKALLGGKGAGLAEMTNAGLPVPPGFTVATTACRLYFQNGNRIPAEVEQEAGRALERLQALLGQKFGSQEIPLLVSVRSGAEFSMPGMMDTILNLGLNDKTVEVLARKTGNPRFAYDCYRRFIQMFGDVVLEIPKQQFDRIFEARKKKRQLKLDAELSPADLQQIMDSYKRLIQKRRQTDFPQDPSRQLKMAWEAVFRSWFNPRAITYRRLNKIPEDLGTAVNVQAMVFGNMGDSSGTGVSFTRNPATGAKQLYGEFLMNAQGEDVVAGIRTPVPITELQKVLPSVYQQLRKITDQLERHYRDVQDLEFTIQEGNLYMLQTRNGKRTGPAAVKIAVDLAEEGLITREEAVSRVAPEQLKQLLHPVLDPSEPLNQMAKGLPASPGAAVGRIVFTADEAVRLGKDEPVILVRAETVPDDIHGMEVAVGILTSRGGMTSHAAVVTRGMGKCCVTGCGDAEIDAKKKIVRIGRHLLKRGDWISLDGSTGRVFQGKAKVKQADPDRRDFAKFMSWADEFRVLKVRANADNPRDAQIARRFGAEGIGLCRSEHMFFSPARLPHMQEMIMACKDAPTEKQAAAYARARRGALKKLLPMQRKDFWGLFRAMEGLPVTIRLLDPPLHEFLPKREQLMVELKEMEWKGKKGKKLAETKRLFEVVEGLHELNPMLGMRGCRLGIMYPEITEMQSRAIFEAACACKAQGIVAKPEVMIPLAGDVRELRLQKEIVDRVAEEVFSRKKMRVEYVVGTMVELPAAALSAGEIAQEAQFFSYGTNDLTQTTFGLSRDDCARIIDVYQSKKIWPADPFQVLDRTRVGRLIREGTRAGRQARGDLKIGICGEHGGDPSSIEFCAEEGLDYVSCSAYRVPIARLAAAQASLKAKKGNSPSTDSI